MLAALLAASALLEMHHVQEGPILCPVRRMTGVPCPGCGLSRSFVATAHLRPAEGFAFHPFGPLLFLACALALGAIGVRAASGRWPLSSDAVPRLRRIGWVVAAAWLVWATVRAVAHLT